MYQTEAIHKISDDFKNMFLVSREVTEEYRISRKRRFRFLDGVLRLVAPLF
jgi:hypothetical protein